MRIYGIETEFGLTVLRDGVRDRSSEEAARLLFRPIVSAHRASNVYCDNGARLYLDVGAHPEYATAECADLRTLLAHDRAGEQMMLELATQADEALAADGETARVVMVKNNTDSHGNSYGCHENYLVSRVDDFEAFTAALLPFLVTRQLVCGAGKLHQTPTGTRFVVSQRAEHMLDAVSSATTRSRPMINTRDEPHADPRKHRRMHVIVGDSNLAEVSTWLKVGTTELVLRLLEQRGPGVLTDAALADPLAAIRASALDHHGAARLELADGTWVTALDIQERCLELCRSLDGLDDDLADVLARWERVLTCLRRRDLSPLVGQVEWVTKLSWLRRYADRHRLGDGDPRLAQLDLAWHEITAGGVCRLLESRGAVERLTTPAEVAAAMTQPPANTRAALRGRFLVAARAAGRQVEVDWVQLQVADMLDGTVRLTDPFACTDERVDRLLSRLAEPRAGLGFHFADLPL